MLTTIMLLQHDASAAQAIAKAKEAPAAELTARKEAVEADEAEAYAARASLQTLANLVRRHCYASRWREHTHTHSCCRCCCLMLCVTYT